MKMPSELKKLEKINKVRELNKLRDKTLRFLQKTEDAEMQRSPKPKQDFSKKDLLLFLETFVYAKDALKGIQIDIFSENNPTKNEIH